MPTACEGLCFPEIYSFYLEMIVIDPFHPFSTVGRMTLMCVLPLLYQQSFQITLKSLSLFFAAVF